MAARCFFLWLNQTSPRSSFLLLLFIFALRCVVDSGLKNTTLSFYSTDWQYLAHRKNNEINAGVTLSLKSSHASKYRFMSVWPRRMLAADWRSRRRGGQRVDRDQHPKGPLGCSIAQPSWKCVLRSLPDMLSCGVGLCVWMSRRRGSTIWQKFTLIILDLCVCVCD